MKAPTIPMAKKTNIISGIIKNFDMSASVQGLENSYLVTMERIDRNHMPVILSNLTFEQAADNLLYLAIHLLGESPYTPVILTTLERHGGRDILMDILGNAGDADMLAFIRLTCIVCVAERNYSYMKMIDDLHDKDEQSQLEFARMIAEKAVKRAFEELPKQVKDLIEVAEPKLTDASHRNGVPVFL